MTSAGYKSPLFKEVILSMEMILIIRRSIVLVGDLEICISKKFCKELCEYGKGKLY